MGAGDYVIPLVALDTVALEAGLVDVFRAALEGVCGEVGFPNFGIDVAVGVWRDGVGTPTVSSRELGSNSVAISTGAKKISFLQLSKKESGASAICLSNDVVFKGASIPVCDRDSPCLTCLGVDGDGSDKG